jgi:predicted small integral membrane protein
MLIIRLSKTLVVAAAALYASLVAFGNITDYGSNLAFVEHVLAMDTIFPDATIGYRAIGNPIAHHAAYVLIIAAEVLVAISCWIGATHMARAIKGERAQFARAKTWAIGGLTLGFILWNVGFVSIGGEWFGMWMSSHWNGIASAFRIFIFMLVALIYVSLPESEA